MREISEANPCDRCGATTTSQQNGLAVFGLCLDCSVDAGREFFAEFDASTRARADTEDEWPKPWDEILPTPTNVADDLAYRPHWDDFGPLRTYAGTLYINADGGDPGENEDAWLPFGLYLDRRGGRDE